MRFHLCEVPPGTTAAYQRLHDLEHAVSLELFGEDRTRSPRRLGVEYSDERTVLRGLLFALPGPAPAGRPVGRFGLPEVGTEPEEPRGVVEFVLPLRDNTHLLDDTFIQVGTRHRREGIGTALWGEVLRIAAAHGRDTVLGWTEHLADAPAAERVAPASGDGDLPRDGGTRFAESLGLELAQVERQSRLLLPVEPARLAALRTEAEAAALPAYRIVSWTGPVPEEHLDHVARMNHVLSADAPTGEIDWRPEEWDADRVRQLTEWEHRFGTAVYSLAVDAASGEAAGVTHLHVDDDHPERPEQWNTSVAGAHRGHRLGLLLKAANLERLAREFPQAQYVDTWNADENAHMLAINTALGYRLHGVTGGWQRKLP